MNGRTPYDKIYFTRTSLDSSREYGENKIEQLFAKRGFKIISPEKLSIIEQLQILLNCKEFSTTEGSIAHNVLFLRPDTKVVILRKANYVNSYQLAVNQIAEVNVTYIDAHKSFFCNKKAPYLGPFYLCTTCHVAKYFAIKVQNSLFDKSFWKYLCCSEPVLSKGKHWIKPTFFWYFLWYAEWQKELRHKVRKMLKI